MENRVENSHGTEIPEKSRSLDLKTLYKSRSRKGVENKSLKRKVSAEDGDENRGKTKKSKKEASLSSLKNVSTSSKKSLDKVYHSGLSSGSHDPEALKSGSSERLDSSSGLNGVSSLSLNNKVIQIPRRKRGFVGRKKFDGGHAHKLPDESAGKVGVVDQTNQTATLNGDDLGAQAESLKVKRKKGIHDFKENINSELNSAPHAKKEDVPTSHSAVSNGDSSLKKARRNRRKRKDLAPHSKSSEKEAEPLVDGSTEKGHDLQEDDEENLEQNAARMLSSRFDPSCTGFSSNNKASANGLSFLLSSEQDFGSHRSKSISGSESNSVDNSGRVLRPRKQHNEKGHSRKRRHFYEVLFGNLDAYWVLNQRIKVFWPLDQSWYYGLVNDYDKEKKLHHVKYDDRDEEWIDLQNERFKLLLLPSEVPGKTEQKKSKVRNRSPDERKGDMKCRKEKKKRDLTSEDGSRIGSYMDTEPIISWLARSTGRVKSSSCAVKKQKTSGLSLKSVPPLSDEDATLHESLGDGSSRRDKNKKISRHPARSSDDVRQEKSTSQGSTGFKDSKMPIVYFRRRLRKNESELSHTSEDDHASVSKLGSLYDFLGSLDANGPLWSIDDAGLLKLTPPRIEPGRVTFELGLPVHSITNDSFGVEFWLFRAAMLCRYGAVVISWPKIYLEMLFVDNVVGLRFLLFEGCLKQAVAFVFLVLSLFHQPNDQGKSSDFQLPATSIRFKFSCGQHLGKQLVFAFYNFLELKNSKWKYLDSQLMSHCLLTKKLPPSECTYDSIKALQIGRNQSPFMSLCAHSSFVKGTQRRSRQGINFMGGSKESTSVNISHPTSRNDELCRKLPPLALSFAAAPTFFISLHLKLLMENCVANICFGDRDSVEHVENSGSMLAVDWSIVEDFISGGSKITPQKNLKAPPSNATSDGSCAKPDAENAISVCHGARTNSSQHFQNGGLDVSVSSGGTGVLEKTGTDEVVQSKAFQSHHPESDQCSLSPRPLVGRDKSDTDSQSFPNGLSVEIPSFDRYEKPVDKEVQSAQQPTEFSWNMNGSIIPSPNPTAPRSTGHRNRNNSSLGHLSHNWSDGTDLFHNGFGSGPKKPRTQVSYTLPYGGFDFSSKQRNLQKGLPHKRIRRANNEKRSSDASRGSQRNLELLSCEANVLVNGSDRGWRECGAHVVLELFDHNEWKLAVKISGTTKYSYKAHQFLQPGTTNRYTHAMMWKGGKDWNWGLEFPDRSQWALFREMHEECYNRNIRSASVKNIPIPGVRLIEESDDNLTEISFLRSSAKYFRQIETDVEMALDPSRVLYDMDSDDEQWILKFQNSSEVHNCGSTEIEDEMFEKTMDMFEKAAFDQQCDEFTSEEIEELVDGAGVGPMDLILSIYEHWQQKRLRKGMPLIRHLQPPSWERYQQQVKEWEQAMIKTNTTLPNGCHGKPASVEKPPMFAFCLKPRGLEVPNKGSKQRSQRKFSVSGHNGVMLGDHDGFHAFGRRSNGFSFGDERVVYAGHNYDSLEDSPLSQTSPGVFSPRDAANMLMSNDGFERNHLRRIHRSKSKKYGRMVSSVGPQMVSSYSPRVVGNRNEVHRWNAGMPDWSSQRYYQPEVSPRHGMGLLDDSDLDEFRLRDASGAAQHAHKMARLKRDKAQRLFYRADLAIHRAVVSLMTAEAIKTSSEDSSDDEE